MFTSIVVYMVLHCLFFYFSDSSILDECGLDDDTKSVLIENIKRRLTPQAVKIRAGMDYLSLSCKELIEKVSTQYLSIRFHYGKSSILDLFLMGSQKVYLCLLLP